MPGKDKKDGKPDEKKTVATHRKARQFYEILEVIEAGLQLRGAEVKSLRQGRASLDGCFGRIDGDELWLENFYIPPYSFATGDDVPDPRRKRKLLLHAAEIGKIGGKLTTKGLTLVPLEVYFRKGWAKVALGLAKGKTGADRRDDLKAKAERRDAEKSFKASYRG
jgi:SsrA-binding protein